jgi:hypothetical protein
MYCIMHYTAADLAVGDLRKLLTNLGRPDRLDTPWTRELLRAHGRLPATPSALTVGSAAARLLTEKIAELKESSDDTWAQRLPHSVLETCFVRGRKNQQAAQDLGLSERQLSRERTRAVQLLASNLAPPATTRVALDPIPPIDGHLPLEALVHRLASAIRENRLVSVTGKPGAGKTSVVAALARLVRGDLVWWLRIRPGLNDCLESLLLELGRGLALEGFPALRDYLLGALPRPNLGTATRVALDGIAQGPRLVILDDFDRASDRQAIAEFLEEAAERVVDLSVVTIGSSPTHGAIVQIPPLSRGEVDTLMQAKGASCPGMTLDALCVLTAGHSGMLAAAGSWWSGQAGARKELVRELATRGSFPPLVGIVRFVAREAV